MKMKFFVISISESEAVNKVKLSLADIDDIKFETIEIEKYWKQENVYTVLISIDNHFHNLDLLLCNYSDNWMSFGSPINEYLASDHNEKASYMREDFLMIQIFTDL